MSTLLVPPALHALPLFSSNLFFSLSWSFCKTILNHTLVFSMLLFFKCSSSSLSPPISSPKNLMFLVPLWLLLSPFSYLEWNSSLPYTSSFPLLNLFPPALRFSNRIITFFKTDLYILFLSYNLEKEPENSLQKMAIELQNLYCTCLFFKGASSLCIFVNINFPTS